MGSGADLLVAETAPIGELLDVEILLPGVTVFQYETVNASPGAANRQSAIPDAVADVMLYDRDVYTVDDLEVILRRFETEWGFTDESCAKIAPFLAEARTRLAEAGGDTVKVNWRTTFAISFQAPDGNGVSAGMSVRLPPTSFSTYTVLSWDPNLPSPDTTVTVGGTETDVDESTPPNRSCLDDATQP